MKRGKYMLESAFFAQCLVHFKFQGVVCWCCCQEILRCCNIQQFQLGSIVSTKTGEGDNDGKTSKNMMPRAYNINV